MCEPLGKEFRSEAVGLQMKKLLSIECQGVVNLGWLPQAGGDSTISKLLGILHIQTSNEAINAIATC